MLVQGLKWTRLLLVLSWLQILLVWHVYLARVDLIDLQVVRVLLLHELQLLLGL